MPGILIKPVVYEEFHATLELKIPSRVFDFSQIRFRLNRKSILIRKRNNVNGKLIFECPKPRNYFLLTSGRFEWKNNLNGRVISEC